MKPRQLIRPFCRLDLIGGLCLLFSFIGSDVVNAQGQAIRQLQAAVKQADALIKKGQNKEAAELAEKISAEFDKLSKGGPNVIKNLKSAHEEFKAVYSKLELEGFKLPAWKELGAEPTGGTSFVKDVAPILVAKCGNCHVEKASGKFSMRTFPELMKGKDGLAVLFPGKADGSRIVEVIVEGDMPRGGGKVSKEELTTLGNWINEGAKFDGEDATAVLSSLVPKSDVPGMPKAEIKVATGKETVSFAMDIAPVLIANCSGCHINAQNVRGNFNMTTFEGMVRGGDGGAPFVAGIPAESGIVKRLKSTGNDRMPMGRDPLAPEVIAKIEKWIAEGATYDGGDPKDSLQTVYAVAKATRSTHEELMKERVDKSLSNWRLGMPSIDSKQVETKNFLLVGNVPEAELNELAKEAEKIVPQVARTFKVSTKDPLVKGRITLFVFKQRYDYSEFGKMVEQTTLPKDQRGHWKYDIVDAYAAILPDRAEEFQNDVLIGQQIAGVFAASLGKDVPRWFAEGSARVAASRMEKKDPRVKAWEDSLAEIGSRMTNPDDFLTGKMSTEDADIMSYKFVEYLMANSRGYGLLLAGLKKGASFEQVFQVVYGGTPSQLAQKWLGGNKTSGNPGTGPRRGY